MQKKPLPTLRDIAKEAGVSRMAVSVVLNGARTSTRVSETTRTRILEAAARLQYTPNGVARGLTRRRMNTIGLVFQHGSTPAYTNPFLIMVLDGVLAVSTRCQQSTMLCTVESWDSHQWPPELSDGRCDGVLLMVPPAHCSLPGILKQRGVPMVVIGDEVFGQDSDPSELPEPSEQTPSVGVDGTQAAYEITRYLLEIGHRRIAFVRRQGNALADVRNRQAGYQDAMSGAGLDTAQQMILTLEEAQEISLSDPKRPTALFCTSDYTALSVLEHLQRRGIRIPEDLSVVGFDDIPQAASSLPPLTTVRQPLTRIGERAAERLLTIIDGSGPSDAPFREVLPTALILRGSAGKAPEFP